MYKYFIVLLYLFLDFLSTIMTILRDSTNQRHRQVEALPVIQDLLHGRMTPVQYVRYLAELAEIYSRLEDLASEAGILVGLPGIHRTNLIRQDIQELEPDLSWTTCVSTRDYLRYLDHVQNERPQWLLAHVYVRHMGDLYGGKLLARQVPGQGLAYQFQDRPALIRAFNQRLYPELATEANLAFDWFILIFQELGDRLGSGLSAHTVQETPEVPVESSQHGLASSEQH